MQGLLLVLVSRRWRNDGVRKRRWRCRVLTRGSGGDGGGRLLTQAPGAVVETAAAAAVGVGEAGQVASYPRFWDTYLRTTAPR